MAEGKLDRYVKKRNELEDDEVVGLMKQMTEESLAQAQSRISAMQKMLARAWVAYKGLDKVLTAIRKEYGFT